MKNISIGIENVVAVACGHAELHKCVWQHDTVVNVGQTMAQYRVAVPAGSVVDACFYFFLKSAWYEESI